LDVQSRALALLLSPTVSKSFNLSHEPAAMRDNCGRRSHVQGCLLARRLIELDLKKVG
jgi:Protein of unknown function (DUF1501)